MLAAAALCAVVACVGASLHSLQHLSSALREIEGANPGHNLGRRQAANIRSALQAQLVLFNESAEHKAKFVLLSLTKTDPLERANVLSAFYAAQMQALRDTQSAIDKIVGTVFAHKGGFGEKTDEEILEMVKQVKTQVVFAREQSSQEAQAPRQAQNYQQLQTSQTTTNQAQEDALRKLAAEKVSAERRDIRKQYGNNVEGNVQAHQDFSAGYTNAELLEHRANQRRALKLAHETHDWNKNPQNKKRVDSSSESDSDTDSSEEISEAYVERCPFTGKTGKPGKKCSRKTGIEYADPEFVDYRKKK